MRRVVLALAGLVVAVCVAADAQAATCLSADRSPGCARGRAMENPDTFAVSRDGRALYVPSGSEATAAVLRVDPRTGAIRQSPGRDGCLAGLRVSKPEGPFGVRYAASCTRVRGVAPTIKDVGVSPDGRHVYVISAPDEAPGLGLGGDPPGLQAVAVLTRRAGGSFRQPAGRAGCVANRRVDGCTVERTVRATEISVSGDGRQVYPAGSSTVTVMERDRRTGTLRRRSCLATGKVPGCGPLPLDVRYPGAPSFSPDGRTAYFVTARFARDDWRALLLALDRDPATGALSARDAPAGCLSATPFRTCVVDGRLDGVVSPPVFSPDGRDAYAVTGALGYEIPLDPDVPFAIAGFKPDPATGALAAAGASCLSRLDRAGCIRDRRLTRLWELAIAPDGSRLYTIRGPGLAMFARDPETGAVRLAALLPGVAPSGDPTEIRVAPGGRHLFVAAHGDYASGTIAALPAR